MIYNQMEIEDEEIERISQRDETNLYWLNSEYSTAAYSTAAYSTAAYSTAAYSTRRLVNY